MALFRKLLTLALLAIAYSSFAFGFTSNPPIHERLATRRSISIGTGVEIEAFHPASTFETFETGVDHPLSKRANFSLPDASVAFVKSKFSKSSVKFRTGFSGDVTQHAFLTQTHDGIPFANAVANVAFNKNNKVVSLGSSLVTPTTIASSTPTIPLADAITIAENALNGTFNDHPPTLEFFAKPDNTAVLTHVIQIQNDDTGAWFEAFVDAHSGDLVSATDFVAKTSYVVLPITKEVLTDGFETLTDPQDLLASPLGWLNTGTVNSIGNNALSFGGPTNTSTSGQVIPDEFIFTQDPTIDPTAGHNLDSARVNAFYIVNTMHDLTYRYGFTEAAFNFQVNNFGKGGLGNDQITISNQDNGGLNNADFATPPDGQPGRMRMFLWTFTNPRRDGALENDIVIHENTHGVTNRITGGGTARCLQTTEAAALGEGWSDAMADWNVKTSAAVPDFVLGPYVTNNRFGIRSLPYSVDTAVNDLRYEFLRFRTEVHSIGEFWAQLLHVVYADLVAAHGWSATARTDPTGTEGNIIFLHLFLDALALQPCNPTFMTARDSWIQADINRYEGANVCLLWNAFASRGLGLDAQAAGFIDGDLVPPACVGTQDL